MPDDINLHWPFTITGKELCTTAHIPEDSTYVAPFGFPG
jgi:hypothetical protein